MKRYVIYKIGRQQSIITIPMTRFTNTYEMDKSVHKDRLQGDQESGCNVDNRVNLRSREYPWSSFVEGGEGSYLPKW